MLFVLELIKQFQSAFIVAKRIFVFILKQFSLSQILLEALFSI